MHDPLRKYSFRTKITTGITAIVVLLGLTLAAIASHLAADSLLDEARKRGRELAQNLAARSADSILASDFLRLKNMVDETVAGSYDVIYAFIQDSGGRVLAHTFSEGFPVELLDANAPATPPGEDMPQTPAIQLLDADHIQIYDFAARVGELPRSIGVVRVGLSRTAVVSEINDLLAAIFAVTGGALILAVALGSIFSRNVTQRINLLRASAEEVVKGNLDLQTGQRMSRNCWEIMDCGLRQCPAYGDERRRCWFIAGTLCPECNGDEFPEKIDSCRDCQVYRENVGDEIESLAESFDVMSLTLKTHINELKAAEENLARQQRLLSTIFDVTPDLMSLQDADLTFRVVNRAFCRFAEADASSILGRSQDEFPIGDAEAERQWSEKVMEARRLQTRELAVGDDDSELSPPRQWFHVVKVPVLDEQGAISGLLTTARDITVLKRYQDKLVHSQKMEDLGKLAGGVAHEINTPLGIILGYAQMLLEDMSPQGETSQMREDVWIIERQAQICRKIVSDLLSFSRQNESSMGEVDLAASLQSVIDLVRHIFQQERVEIVADLAQDIPRITADAERLRSIWMNLLSNAFDAIGWDGTIYVEARSCAGGRRVVVRVIDSGTGITPQDKSKIFDPFFTTKEAGKGTGLGLSLSYGIVQEHGGRMMVDSPVPRYYRGKLARDGAVLGPGAMFTVELPVDPKRDLEDGESGHSDDCRQPAHV
jgi:PAS domain S-box-containing protein